MGTVKFDAEQANRVSIATRVLSVPVRKIRAGEIKASGAVPVLYDAPLSDEAIARCKARAARGRP